MVLDWIDFGILFLVVLVLIIIVVFIFRSYRRKLKGYRAKYPNSYLCNDGHRCRSLSELIIDNCLFRNGIIHKEEGIIRKNSGKKYKYDWYLPEIKVYIEFFGYSGKKYKKTRQLKEKFYKKHHLRMIPIEPNDLINIEENLKKKIGKYWNKIVTTEFFCPQCGGKIDNRIR